ncbi:uncharacterized protein LY79DRAFT_583216 [Colletotrichum navitas]|uniref:Uncharacterized protein n=1 Tax=Colletotrichum navitas TaxID=681940 RepID=A0AAD8PQS8_9PEZI|nr:uncharacterized protein LY79DRAFT_583216 [Colletotrichum navitas]KAK1574040.1 hypothetical protein LY79DRAFT_583216 [Colletotrichum navitas]
MSTRLGACLTPLPTTVEAFPHHRTAWNVCQIGTPEQAGRPSLKLEMDDSSRGKIFGRSDDGLRGPGISAFGIGHRAIVRPQRQALRDVYEPPRPLACRRLRLVHRVAVKLTPRPIEASGLEEGRPGIQTNPEDGFRTEGFALSPRSVEAK